MKHKPIALGAAAVALILAAAAWLRLGVTSTNAIAPVAESSSPAIAAAASSEADPVVPASASEDERTEAPRTELGEASVRVTDLRDAPIAGAELQLVTGNGQSAKRLGQTSSAGLFELEEPPPAGSTLVARAAGFATTSRAIGEHSAETDARIVLRMAPSAELRGRVIDTHGAAVGAGVRVLAWPSTPISSGHENARRALAGDPREHLVSTDEAGAFLFDDLPANQPVFLVAAGKGIASASLADAKAGRSEDLTVTVEPTYAAIVGFVSTAGVRLTAHDGPVQSDIRTCSGCASRVTGTPFILSNAGAKLETWPGLALSALVACEQAAPHVTGNRLRAMIEGYVDVDAELDLLPLDDDLPVTIVSVLPLAEGMGRIEVRFVTAGRPIDAALRDFVPEGVLTLSKDFGNPLLFAIQPELDAPFSLEAPFGTYRPCFRADAGEFVYPPAELASELVVGPIPAQLAIEVRGLGAISVSAIRSDGEPSNEPFSFQLARGRPEVILSQQEFPGLVFPAGAKYYRGAQPYRHLTSPVILRGLSPGEYTVIASSPTRGALDGNADGIVTVAAGRVTEVKLRLQ